MKEIDLKKLAEPFPASEIQWRVGATSEREGKIKGLALAYYDARALYDRLDAVCGPENWQIRYPHANGKTCAEIGIKIGGEWVWKANGAGDTQTEAEKGAFSDAAKRAGVPWGIGRYLYEMTDTWVECEVRGKSKAIKKSEFAKLDAAYKRFVETGVKPAFKNDEEDETKPEAKPAKAVDDAEMNLILNGIADANSPMEFQDARSRATAASPRMNKDQVARVRRAVNDRMPDFPQAPPAQANGQHAAGVQ